MTWGADEIRRDREWRARYLAKHGTAYPGHVPPRPMPAPAPPSTDHMMLDASVSIEEEILLERRRDGCAIAGIDFDQDAELREMRDPRNWIEVLAEKDVPAIMVPFYDPRAWTFWGILKLFGWVAITGMVIGWIWGR